MISAQPGAGIMNLPPAAPPEGHTVVSKLLLLILAAVAIYLFLAGASRNRKRRGDPPPEAMVPCARCGVNLPRSEALEAGGRFFCSDEHRQLGSA
jgi:uncharacterized protein